MPAWNFPILLVAAAMLAACSADRGDDGINDPYEPMNRKVHAFNRGLDARVVKPLGSGMSGGNGVGSHAVGAVGNFGSNLAQPGKVVNHLLQGKPGPAARSTLRFLVNTTLGLAGFLDPAGSDFALPEEDTDFGQTLATWGVGEGPYLELPLIGPSTQRDAVGRVVDLVIDPMRGWLNRDQYLIGMGARVASKAGERGRFGDSVDSILHESADSYAQTRLIWLQHRRHELGEEGEHIDPYAE
ncbi:MULTISPECIES: MlaA family lipoprotein [Paracoccus]|uniref:VacJ family lipoprotein n=1 Tax=Paracoccus denitrificans (strain Pd 1222) TaxID=318586 RepID=A1B3N3_PARDP|nr:MULTISPECIES: VacJ family lipoprotein [Paracoccus]ABL70127.1 VacJ family lipoprotein [Paracoccus denitrificans PD1222]MBB4628845.1 phospholipid-binding lipoprotein MlaA [Paracoccus denitrificans]MCU7429772.1 VacJ family lipoprotein [Paracoccus denitrificans]UFS65386.1 VacJ family lipoprotein [Paracoccus denitrificans]UPV94388.1 VacJ family lipoprotein [Paracoccus denitrificans]